MGVPSGARVPPRAAIPVATGVARATASAAGAIVPPPPFLAAAGVQVVVLGLLVEVDVRVVHDAARVHHAHDAEQQQRRQPVMNLQNSQRQ